MGCDIHAHLEIKFGGEWHHYTEPNVDRNYRLFGRMAGVRDGSVIPIMVPRGLPADMSKVTAFDYQHREGDAHTPSWFSIAEIEILADWLKREQAHRSPARRLSDYFGYLFGNSINEFRQYPDDYPEYLEDVRLVFWFDN